MLVFFLGIYNSIDLLKVTGFDTMFNDGMPHAGNMIIQKKSKEKQETADRRVMQTAIVVCKPGE